MTRKLAPVRYDEYVGNFSPAWQRKRLAAFRYYGRRCAMCGATKRLEVHHLTYDRLGHEWLIDLQVLCHRCHLILTFILKIKKLFSRLGKR